MENLQSPADLLATLLQERQAIDDQITSIGRKMTGLGTRIERLRTLRIKIENEIHASTVISAKTGLPTTGALSSRNIGVLYQRLKFVT
jgi:hypothetical protein